MGLEHMYEDDNDHATITQDEVRSNFGLRREFHSPRRYFASRTASEVKTGK